MPNPQTTAPLSFMPGKCYAMATRNGNEAEIVMYGQVVKKRPVDWWTGKPVEGDFIVQSEFLEDLKTVDGAGKIFIRLDSVGGDTFAALPIYNRLMELKAEITVQVDGVAMSAGSFIMCAGDTVKVHQTSLVMIHGSSILMLGWYNMQDLDKERGLVASVNKALVSAYVKKTGRTEAEIEAMLQAETFMTGDEAMEKGFADELVEGDDDVQIAASVDRSIIYAGGRMLMIPTGAKLPDSIPTVTPAPGADEINKTPATSGSNKGGHNMPKTADELRKENPEAVAEIETAAKAAAAPASPDPETLKATAQAERERLKAIDEIAPSINDAALVEAAKYGEKPMTAEQLALAAMKKQSAQGARHQTNTQADYQQSGAAKVGAAPTGGQEDPDAQVNAAIDAGVEAAKKAQGGK